MSFWYYEENNLLAVDAINAPRDYMIGKRLIETKISPKKEIVKVEAGIISFKNLKKNFEKNTIRLTRNNNYWFIFH